MTSINQLVDVAHVFRRLRELPGHMAGLRLQVAELQGTLRDAEWDHETAQATSLEAVNGAYSQCKNEAARKHFKAILFRENANVRHSMKERNEAEDTLNVLKAQLYGAQDEMSGLRNTVRLVMVLSPDLFAALDHLEDIASFGSDKAVINGNGG